MQLYAILQVFVIIILVLFIDRRIFIVQGGDLFLEPMSHMENILIHDMNTMITCSHMHIQKTQNLLLLWYDVIESFGRHVCASNIYIYTNLLTKDF